MLVLVRYNDDNYDIVEDYCLEYLIVTGKVIEFSRSDEWVSVGNDPTREKPADKESPVPQEIRYAGPDRRKKTHRNLLHNPQTPATT
ncbi:hypothetical protein OR1_01581 [Geobacter sp. OR-1]|uniref:GSU3473 family protein n=1 Tax=Geobacter sp. OR-1 TaxID=1266765 RepID=UPI000542D35D|nr:hypothetical protein [Geobacter sp. OR-1]GAM09306.1 hypothetical protein OR1_01581 [Geobacter sp. OR-1]